MEGRGQPSSVMVWGVQLHTTEGRGQQFGDGVGCIITHMEGRGQQLDDGVGCTITHIRMGEVSQAR